MPEHGMRDNYQLRNLYWPNAEFTEIPNCLLWANVSLARVVIPHGVTTIDEFALGMLWSCEHIFLPGTLTSAESDSFDGLGASCASLTVEMYAPAANEWDSKWKAYFRSDAKFYHDGSNGYAVQEY